MPADFSTDDHGLNKLKVAVRNGVVFACFDHEVEPLEDYLGSEILAYFDRTFDGRKLVLHGYSRQRIPGNWKLMMENIKDPYHPGLLHTWFVTFGLWRADNESRLRMDGKGRHAAMLSRRADSVVANVEEGVTSYRKNMDLHDKRLLDIVHEPWWGDATACLMTVFPNVILQQQVNSLSTRQIIPAGPDHFDFIWTHFGFEEMMMP
jgi:salicylate 5-hydroxylase large subunit